MTEHVDVLIVGAGISGIGAGYYIQSRCPDHSFAIVEAREDIGGTWDLFRYPGIRSDSDMYTLGYSFRPWKEEKAIADGDAILKYVNETADEYRLRRHIRFQHRVTGASWSTEDARWTVDIERGDTGATTQISCGFLFMCSGYYDYEEGYTPEFAGRERFAGRIVHPQKWTEDIDYTDKRVVIIGSGATAVTLAPVLAQKAAHVVMLQRSPTYIISMPSEDAAATWLREKLPARWAYFVTRWKNVLFQSLFYNVSRRAPGRMKKLLRKGLESGLTPDIDIDKHFTPHYDPWDQRLCLIPDGDLFDALNAGSVSMVTEHIESFTEDGILLRSGEVLEADLIVTATGLKMQFLAGVGLVVDGEPVDPSQTMTYKAMMFSDVPNLALSFGYTNASWTLKADLTGEYVCRLLNHMRRHGYRKCVPHNDDPQLSEEPFLRFTSGYIQRAAASMPKQGNKRPWKLAQNYLLDILEIRHGRIDDAAMKFS